ncbi:Cof-type HAD-IIB family hydrolase [Glaesserella parasuis]|uniref:Cof-type HAD-IIB family hydrolase n=1 Tax=Glaesserella parasuis TaxID=738 RepID=UPI0024365E39|nr:Cof-type HAD-IIB family hydrolase [Glaesserella parasuis]MDG6832999.1 Cof-type HAD-IIB family hydrolase [Glaesserella parasuis]MDO9959166.1 Cof-type HAD-IIB family hydrolase [Glaesserella parasuis]MDP0052550.1 Cof-type HAD-IIB family hydrolase [Glaesserella parasuis]
MQKPTAPIKIVFFDIDETLYYKKETRIPLSISEQVLPRLRAKGIIPAIATGRTYGAFPKAIKPLMNEKGFDLFVTTNGQYNLYRDQVISEYPLTTERIERILAKLQALQIEYAFVTAEQIAASKNTAEVEESLRPIKEDYIVDPNFYLDHLVIQLLAFFPQERTEEVIRSGILEDDLKEVRWHKYSVDLLNKNNSKARGIEDVLNHFGFGIENAMAFGDGLNDLEMIATVGFGVAMGNAEDELKAVADYVTLPIEQDGILVALEKLGVI